MVLISAAIVYLPLHRTQTLAISQQTLTLGYLVAVESVRLSGWQWEPQVRVGISGTHGTGKTTLAQALCAHLPGHVAVEEPYCLLEDEGYEFGLPPSVEDYRALLARSVQCLTAPPLRSAIIFDRTPLDYLAYLAAAGAEPCSGPSPAPTHRLPHRTWPPGRLTRE